MQNVDRTMMEAYAAELKNWQKWGPDDEFGTLNYVTPEMIVEAAGLIRKRQGFFDGHRFWFDRATDGQGS